MEGFLEMMIERDFLGLMSSSSKNGCIDHGMSYLFSLIFSSFSI